MSVIRELAAGETAVAFDAMRELRTDLESVDEFVGRVNEVQRREGYRLVGSFEPDVDHAVAVAGFRTGHALAFDHYLYVDDLVTMKAHRRRGHADALMTWLLEESERLGCSQLHLDSATHRYGAHAFYLSHGLVIPSFHFARYVG